MLETKLFEMFCFKMSCFYTGIKIAVASGLRETENSAQHCSEHTYTAAKQPSSQSTRLVHACTASRVSSIARVVSKMASSMRNGPFFCIQTFWRRFMVTNEAANSFPAEKKKKEEEKRERTNG